MKNIINNHVHINTGQKKSRVDAKAFESNFNNTGQRLQTLSAQNVDAQRMGGGGGGTTIVAPQTTKVSQSSTTAVIQAPTAEDSWWRKIDRLLD